MICVLVFAYATKRFSHGVANIEGFVWLDHLQVDSVS